MRLFLFDIDGTLVNAGGVGRTAVSNALTEVYGTTGAIDGYDFRGRTDPRIVLDLIGAAGWDEADIHARLTTYFDVYLRELDALVGDGARVRVLPGVGDVVRALSAREDAVVGLLTGNIEPGARVKLRSTGLWPLFRVGAFGSDDVDRRRLPAVARRRAHEALGHDIPFDRVTIIGDTPLDVDCARASGALAVAVATGRYTGDELSACSPDVLFPDLSDVESVIDALCAGPKSNDG
ncbi:MAG TPA: haloacid dehalogenase-like hydrolase [Candidatus Acidoferrum sp.]|nr:haloacid dehalogenase-like hydrolase [Candidatus Acidoferrum sp.]